MRFRKTKKKTVRLHVYIPVDELKEIKSIVKHKLDQSTSSFAQEAMKYYLPIAIERKKLLDKASKHF